MKKLIIFLFVWLFMAKPLFAENPLGIKGGLTRSTIKGGDDDFKNNFYFGIFKDIHLIKDAIISYELNYHRQSCVLKNVEVEPYDAHPYGFDVYDYDFHITIGYIEISNLIKPLSVKLTPTHTLTPYIGYSFGVPFGDGTKRKNKNYSYTISSIEDIGAADVKAVIEPWPNASRCLNIGCSVDYFKWTIELRYSHDINGIGTFESVHSFVEDRYKWRTLSLLIGYKL